MTSLDHEISRAREILAGAVAEYAPVEVFAGFSGGHDSLVTTHFTMAELSHAHALHLNTGIGIEKTPRFVRETAKDRGWHLAEVRTPESFDLLVLGLDLAYPGGFPGSPMHPLMYQRLKQRALRIAGRDARAAHARRRGRRWIMVVTGIRGDESRVRTGYKRAVSVEPKEGIVWVNPFYWATYDHFKAYRQLHELPVNDVCLNLGFSGECLCGAHADKGELLRIRMVEPETADRIEDLQRRVADLFPWGYEDNGPPKWFTEQKRGQVFFDFYQTACGKAAGPSHRPMCHNREKVKAVPPNVKDACLATA